jgi:hypothetical protein
MISDVLCLDINHDGTTDILTVGEWMGVDVWEISEHGFEKTTNLYFDHSYSGLWNTLVAEDIDGDGDLDLLVGNMGLNTHLKANDTEPLEMIYADFDQNGSIDPFLCCFVQGASYPYSTRDELADQIFTKRSKFPTHKSYANATIKDLFTPAELKESKTLRVNDLETCLFINEGGKFNKMALPIQAQYAPVYKILVMDVDNDQKKDIILLGNQSDFKIRLGKCDANYGIVLKNEGNNRFSYLPQLQTGLSIKGDVKDACYDPVQKLLYITRNQDEIITYSLQTIQ